MCLFLQLPLLLHLFLVRFHTLLFNYINFCLCVIKLLRSSLFLPAFYYHFISTVMLFLPIPHVGATLLFSSFLFLWGLLNYLHVFSQHYLLLHSPLSFISLLLQTLLSFFPFILPSFFVFILLAPPPVSFSWHLPQFSFYSIDMKSLYIGLACSFFFVHSLDTWWFLCLSFTITAISKVWVLPEWLANLLRHKLT